MKYKYSDRNNLIDGKKERKYWQINIILHRTWEERERERDKKAIHLVSSQLTLKAWKRLPNHRTLLSPLVSPSLSLLFLSHIPDRHSAGSGFIGFRSPSSSSSSPSSSSSLEESWASSIPDELRVEFKQLRKKEEKTKLKALANLTRQLTEYVSDVRFLSPSLSLSLSLTHSLTHSHCLRLSSLCPSSL